MYGATSALTTPSCTNAGAALWPGSEAADGSTLTVRQVGGGHTLALLRVDGVDVN